MSHKGWIGVDLDATLVKYDRWVDIENIGEPVWPMVTRVKQWLLQGQEVRIFTARVWYPDDRWVRSWGWETICPPLEGMRALRLEMQQEIARSLPGVGGESNRQWRNTMLKYIESFIARKVIEDWCQHMFGQMLPVTCQKDPGMIELWDDRCVPVEANTGRRTDMVRGELGEYPTISATANGERTAHA